MSPAAKQLKEILQNLDIGKIATIYVARHTFPTVLKRSGASTESIQEAHEHTDIKITESCLDSFDLETKNWQINFGRLKRNKILISSFRMLRTLTAVLIENGMQKS